MVMVLVVANHMTHLADGVLRQDLISRMLTVIWCHRGLHPPRADGARAVARQCQVTGLLTVWWCCCGQDLISRMLTVDVSKRLTPAEALRHPWLLKDDVSQASPKESPGGMTPSDPLTVKYRILWLLKDDVSQASPKSYHHDTP
jgi:hypothetical protein